MRYLHSWKLGSSNARKIQEELAARVVCRDDFGEIRAVAGADIALDATRRVGVAGVIVYDFPSLKERARVYAVKRLTFPYVPGLLAFREGPALLTAFRKLKKLPDLVFFDGQGVAHPRRLGIASHMGLWLNRPTIGCAKSVLVGEHDEPEKSRGFYSGLIHKGETVGAALRTRDNVKPVFISIGHRISLPTALKFTLACADGYRVPKPTREADRYVASLKKEATISWK